MTIYDQLMKDEAVCDGAHGNESRLQTELSKEDMMNPPSQTSANKHLSFK